MSAAAIVRDATDADVPAIAPMVRALCAMHESLDPTRYAMRPDVASMYESWLPERIADPESVLLVAEHDFQVAGFLVATVERSIPIDRLATTENTFG